MFTDELKAASLRQIKVYLRLQNFDPYQPTLYDAVEDRVNVESVEHKDGAKQNLDVALLVLSKKLDMSKLFLKTLCLANDADAKHYGKLAVTVAEKHAQLVRRFVRPRKCKDEFTRIADFKVGKYKIVVYIKLNFMDYI